MPLTLSETTTAAYTPPEAGTFTARCTGLIDLGSQETSFEGQTKTTPKLLVQFEITDADNRRGDGAPHVISKRFTASLHEKAALRKFLEAWRGRPFSVEELRGFALPTLLGIPCLLGIVHAVKDGRVFANVSTCMHLPRSMTAPAGALPLVQFDLSAPDWQVFAGLPSRLQDQIAASPEYQAAKPPARIALAPQAPAPAPTSAPAPEAVPAGSGFDDLDNDIPF